MLRNTERDRARNAPNFWPVPSIRLRAWIWAAGIAGVALTAPPDAFANVCKPKRPLSPIVVTTMGPCHYDPENFSFAGDPVQQAACLIRPVARWGKLGPAMSSLPPVLADHVGRASDLPNRSALAALLAELHLDRQLGEALTDPISRAGDNDPNAPAARYLVIHDTSGPKFSSFPADIDENRKINNLARFHCSDSAEIAHVIVNRVGDLYVGHDMHLPWRSTKFERALNFGSELKGLFLHVELIQPRRGGRHDVVAPNPGFTTVQYDRLALIYTLASVRAGQWLIPAFHAVIDYDILDGHDDPQNFDLESFAHKLQMLLDRLSPDRATPLDTISMPSMSLSLASSPNPLAIASSPSAPGDSALPPPTTRYRGRSLGCCRLPLNPSSTVRITK
jgi:hypothetical protein